MSGNVVACRNGGTTFAGNVALSWGKEMRRAFSLSCLYRS